MRKYRKIKGGTFMEIVRKTGGFPRTRLRSAGQDRKVNFTKSSMPHLVEIVRDEGKGRIVFTDTRLPGHKAIVSETGVITFGHQWMHWQEGKSLDRIATWPSVSPELSRDIIMARNAKIAQLLDPNVPDTDDIPAISEFILSEIMSLFQERYKKSSTPLSQLNRWFLKYFKDERDKPLNKITRKDVIQFGEWVAVKRSKVTANRCRSLFSVIMNRAVDLEYIDRNPCHGVKKFREPESRTRIFTDAEFKRYCSVLMKHIGHKHAKILYLLVLLALRFEEVASMRWEHFDFEASTYTIPKIKSKNGRSRPIALNAPALELVKSMHVDRDPKNPWVFPARSKSGHTTTVIKVQKKILTEAQIEGFRIHDIRRSGASALLNDYDANPLKIMEILGHSDMRSTMVYSRLSAKSMAETSDLLAHKFNAAVNS
jgi:integrase